MLSVFGTVCLGLTFYKYFIGTVKLFKECILESSLPHQEAESILESKDKEILPSAWRTVEATKCEILKMLGVCQISLKGVSVMISLIELLITVRSVDESLQGVPKKIRHLFSFISPSVLMLQFYALHGQ